MGNKDYLTYVNKQNKLKTTVFNSIMHKSVNK